ncbi:hypothetical protein OEOE_0864 [Oenococcus oeni PSU-1]|uniref:Uncharacterized protein n=1 Tax=Oenococcus oeni (strain ATCC BAA-331 / PSU-1) TaxID=203123 RepID=Q04FJ0_OENOB|nr:hypothetical protein OEOE_0864 [Oenococcus oeni PSU-1]
MYISLQKGINLSIMQAGINTIEHVELIGKNVDARCLKPVRPAGNIHLWHDKFNEEN